MSHHAALKGRTIVITRPVHQASIITGRLQSHGANVIGFPLLEIVPPQNPCVARSQLARLSQYDYVIFTSPNAVTFSIQMSPGVLTSFPRVAAVGKQTAATLRQHGIDVSIVPEHSYNSESLLACEALQNVKQTGVAIIRGEGGRTLLRDTLRQRGAAVDDIEVYRRVCPADSLLPLDQYQRASEIDLIVLTSGESLQHLFRLGKALPWLNKQTLLVGSERIAAQLSGVGHAGDVVIASDPSDDSIFRSLMSWANNKP